MRRDDIVPCHLAFGILESRRLAAVDEPVHVPRSLVAGNRRVPAAPFVVRRIAADASLTWIAVDVGELAAHLPDNRLCNTHPVAILPQCTVVSPPPVERRRDILLQRLHELARMEHSIPQTDLQVFKAAAARHPGGHFPVGLLFQFVPFLDSENELWTPVKPLDALQNLLVRQRLLLREKYEDVEVVRHHAPPQQLHAAEKRRTHHQLDKAPLFLRVKEEGAMRHPRDEMVATIRQDNPILRHTAQSIPQTTPRSQCPIHSILYT